MTEVVKDKNFHSDGNVDPRRTISVESKSIQAAISEMVSKNQ